MKRVSVREFRSKCSKYMAEMPFVLTNYNKPIAVVSKYEKGEVVSKKEALDNLRKLPFFNPQPKSKIRGSKMK